MGICTLEQDVRVGVLGFRIHATHNLPVMLGLCLLLMCWVVVFPELRAFLPQVPAGREKSLLTDPCTLTLVLNLLSVSLPQLQ